MTLALDPDGPIARGSPTMDEGRIKFPFDFKIAMTKRGDNNLYVREGTVWNMDGRYQAVVECDGGGFTIRKAPSGVLLSIGFPIGLGPDYIRMSIVPGPCGTAGTNRSGGRSTPRAPRREGAAASRSPPAAPGPARAEVRRDLPPEHFGLGAGVHDGRHCRERTDTKAEHWASAHNPGTALSQRLLRAPRR
jgi:hypothetical protein